MEAIGSHAYQLEVLEGTRCPNVVHASLLPPFKRRDTAKNMVDDKEEFQKVARIVNPTRVKGLVQYQLWRTGCTEFDDRWKTFDHLENFAEKLEEFGQKFPGKLPDERDV